MRCMTLEVRDNLSSIYETKRGIGFLASFRSNASQEPSPTCTRQDGAHGPFSPSLATGTLGHPWPAGAVSQDTLTLTVPRSKPGTQCHTSATSLRKQISKLRVSEPREKTVHMKCAVTQDSLTPHRSPLPAPSSKPGTQCHTSATSLRK